MARKAAWEDLADGDLGPYGKSRGTRSGRVLGGLLLVVVATFVAAYYLPLYRSHEKLTEQYRELGQRAQSLAESVASVRLELKAATDTRDQLQSEHDSRESAKKASREQQERARAALSAKLDKFVKKGNAAVLVSGDSLYVALDSALLYMPQKLELTSTGRGLLCDVAKTSEAKAIAVRSSLAAGSTVPPALATSYPNSWAWTAGRAAAATQVLEQACAVPAAHLTAVGNGGQSARPGLQVSGDPLELELSLR